MKKFVLIFFALAIFAPISVNAQSAAANKAWAPFLKKFTSAVKTKNRAAILAMALDRYRFETTAKAFKRFPNRIQPVPIYNLTISNMA